MSTRSQVSGAEPNLTCSGNLPRRNISLSLGRQILLEAKNSVGRAGRHSSWTPHVYALTSQSPQQHLELVNDLPQESESFVMRSQNTPLLVEPDLVEASHEARPSLPTTDPRTPSTRGPWLSQHQRTGYSTKGSTRTVRYNINGALINNTRLAIPRTGPTTSTSRRTSESHNRQTAANHHQRKHYPSKACAGGCR